MTEDNTAEKRKRYAALHEPYGLPDFDTLKLSNPQYQGLLIDALNYANYKFEAEQLKKFTTAYNPEINYKDVPSYEFLHVGKLCWLHNKGAELSEKTISDLNTRLAGLEKVYQLPDAVPPVSIKAKETNTVMEEYEDYLDRTIYEGFEYQENFYILPMLNSNVDIQYLIDHTQRQLDDITSTDEDALEGFRGWSAKRKAHVTEVFEFVLEQLQAYTPEKAPVRTRKASVRKPRKVDPAKLVKKLNYMPEFKELSLTSISPEKILGADILWVFNTKTRKLGQYISNSEDGLTIKGSTIYGFDPDTSQQKILRKPTEILNTLHSSGKVAQKTLLDNINSVGSSLTGRINSDTILVKIYTRK